MNVWIVNPFDELPGDTDVRHRYWALAETLTGMDHAVTWWSSDFSHRHKRYRKIDHGGSTSVSTYSLPFNIRLIHTPPYSRNVSLARLRNHRAFARRFLEEARKAIDSGELPTPDRIVVSMPPLGTATAALALREKFGGEIILDIMDAWPETFYRLFGASCPPRLRGFMGRLLLFPLHRTAIRAYRGVNRISAVSRIYINLAKSRAPDKPTHLCYHGIDLAPDESGLKARLTSSQAVSVPEDRAPPEPFKLVYIGALERTYDLETAIRAVKEINREFAHKIQLHIAGAGTREKALRALVPARLGEMHGLLNRAALQSLLASCHVSLIPMRQDSWVGLPYKLADYCAAGLPVLSSLDGECRRLLDTKKAGLFYKPGSVQSLKSGILELYNHPEQLESFSRNSRSLSCELFDRSKTYPNLAEFIIGE